MVTVVMLVLLVLVVVMVAAAIGIIAFVVVVMVVMVTVVMLVLLVLVVVMVATAIGIVTLVVVVMVVMLVLLVLVVMMMAATIGIVALIVVVMVMMVTVVMLVVLMLHASQLVREGVGVLHRGGQLLAVKGRPGRGDDGRRFVVLAQHSDAGLQFFLRDVIGVAEHDATCVLDLIVEELAKVLHIQLALVGVNDGGEGIENDILGHDALHGADDVGQLADARGLDENAVGGEIGQHLRERLGEITDQGAADAALIHFGDLHAALLEKARVNADLAEFVFNEHDLLAGIGFFE